MKAKAKGLRPRAALDAGAQLLQLVVQLLAGVLLGAAGSLHSRAERGQTHLAGWGSKAEVCMCRGKAAARGDAKEGQQGLCTRAGEARTWCRQACSVAMRQRKGLRAVGGAGPTCQSNSQQLCGSRRTLSSGDALVPPRISSEPLTTGSSWSSSRKTRSPFLRVICWYLGRASGGSCGNSVGSGGSPATTAAGS